MACVFCCAIIAIKNMATGAGFCADPETPTKLALRNFHLKKQDGQSVNRKGLVMVKTKGWRCKNGIFGRGITSRKRKNLNRAGFLGTLRQTWGGLKKMHWERGRKKSQPTLHLHYINIPLPLCKGIKYLPPLMLIFLPGASSFSSSSWCSCSAVTMQGEKVP